LPFSLCWFFGALQGELPYNINVIADMTEVWVSASL